MACAWGWDWGPWLTTAGIWRPATLHTWDAARLASVRPVSRIGAAGSDADHGAVTVTGSVERTRDVALTVDVLLLDPHGVEVGAAIATIAPGERDFRLDLDAGPVERWWPAGYGAQPLYSLTLRLVTGEGDATVVLDEWQRRVGFRTVRLDTTADETGSAFTFVVNEQPLFVRGVNWIPDDPFPSRVTPERYRQRLRQAVDANVSMLRVWGGGIYEDDAFYDALRRARRARLAGLPVRLCGVPGASTCRRGGGRGARERRAADDPPQPGRRGTATTRTSGATSTGSGNPCSRAGRGAPASTSTCSPASSPTSTRSEPTGRAARTRGR